MRRTGTHWAQRLLPMAILAVTPALAHAADIVINNVNAPGVGFNDPTPAVPVGGNTGTTLGEQRLIAFRFAAERWGALLPSDVTIVIQGLFFPLPCTATQAVLGSAGTIQIFGNFPGAELQNTWYHSALANKLAGEDLSPGPPDPGLLAPPFNDDIIAFFNSALNGNTACLGGRKFYLGLDGQHGSDIDLVTVLLHEFGHGVGFANFVDVATGQTPLGLGDVFAEYTRDTATGKSWNQMTSAEIVASAVNTRRVVWDGLHVAGDVGKVLAPGTPLLTITAPSSIDGAYPVGAAAFGPPLGAPGVSAQIVAGLDEANPAGPSTTDACTPLSNPGVAAGNIVLVDRGTCALPTKALNAQQAGAVAVIIANNVPGSPPPGLGGTDPAVAIPVVSVAQADAAAIRTALQATIVQATLGIDLSVLSGTEASTGLPLLYAPNPADPGSSISHWDTIAFPNQLMEPAINADLTHDVRPPKDLTLSQLTDIGWFSDADGVPDGRDECLMSDPRATVWVNSCNSGVANTVSVLGAPGCRISDFIDDCFDGNQGGHIARCTAQVTNALLDAGIVTRQQKDAIQSCVGQTK